MNDYYVGIDCGGTNIRIGLVDQNLNILFESKYKSDEVGRNLDKLIENFVNKYKNQYKIKLISIGFPGLVDQNTLNVLNIPNQKSFEGTYLNELQEKLNIPIVIGNDVNVLMLYDAKLFGINENKSILGFYLGTGFGSAIRINNMMYQGDFGAAGEIGHVPIYLRSILYNHKQKDLESVVSGFNLKNIHNEYFSDTPFEEIFIHHLESEPIQDYLHLLAIYITTMITFLDISTIILGGGVIMSDQFPKSYLEKLIQDNLYADNTKANFKVYYAQKSINSGVLGAVINGRNYLNI
ncbi:allose kinase [Acholeplasma granularum]|uniref:allose kinase n=1 Tax=Acholeplasma granularum TaxID=264635 RepID=UPI00046EDDC3|nr:allose kinase [Acholeplasma granularum]